MELDDLKQTWKQTDSKHQSLNKNIMEMIQHKSYGPVAALKRSYKKQIIMMALMPFVLLFTNMDDPGAALTSIMYWSYVALCMGVIVFSFNGYQIADRMQNMDGMVKQNLEQQISLLETTLKWKMIGIRIALLIFILLTEIVPHFQHYRMLDKWHSLSPFIRFGAYGLLFFLQYMLNPIVAERKFGRHLAHLRGMMKEMD